MKRHKVQVVDFPRLPWQEINLVQKKNWTFAQTRAAADLPSMSRTKVKRFLKEAYTAFESTGRIPMPQPSNQPQKYHQSRLDEASDALMQLAAQMGIDPTDPLVLVARGNARLEEKVEQWTQTNLHLLELLSQQVEEQQRSAQHYSRLIHYLNGFDR